MNDYLTDDTKAIMLLCGYFGKDRSEKPLSHLEYSSVVRWLMESKMRPGDLLQADHIPDAAAGTGIVRERLAYLLSRGVKLGFAVEEWQRNGIWILSRSDSDYPVRYKRHLREQAPPLLYGVGDRQLISSGGLAMVGSRNVDMAGEDFTRHVAERCARSGIPVISGGARGVDQISMSTSLDCGGVAIGVVAEKLMQKAVSRQSRDAIADGRLLLISPYHPDARFTVGTAMGRNKLIYGLADYGLVVSAESNKGGTWAGAEEELGRANPVPVFVRLGSDTPSGNRKLLEFGAIPWPGSINGNDIRNELVEHSRMARGGRKRETQSLLGFEEFSQDKDTASASNEESTPECPEIEEQTLDSKPSDLIYNKVLPVLIGKLENAMTPRDLANHLDLSQAQLKRWLDRAVEEKRLVKLSKPLRYQDSATEQLEKSRGST